MSERKDLIYKQAEKKAEEITEKLKKLSVKIALAESCTAGMISALLANTEGASGVLWGSFVCYTQEAKVSMLGLDNERLNTCGLVSRETACSMAQAAMQKSCADIGASVTGLAGPFGDGSGVPVGTVWTSAALKNGRTEAREYHFKGSRNAVRAQAAVAALDLINEFLNKHIDINTKNY